MATQTRPRAQSTKNQRAQSTKNQLMNGAKSAGSEIGSAAEKAKGPALAGGAALAGLAGGLLLAGRSRPRRMLGVPIPGTRRPLIEIKRGGSGKELVKAAGKFGELASEMRLAREELEAKRKRSPIEVVLDGLTHRPRA
jgi:hypothetical protein